MPQDPAVPARAVLYARVSSKEQEKDGFSIPAQQKLLRHYAAERAIHLAKEFTDVETAKRSGRTGFGEMIAFLRRNQTCRIILVEKTDRLYRYLKDWVTIDGLEVVVHFVKENFVLSGDSRSSEKFVHGIKVLMAKNYIDNLTVAAAGFTAGCCDCLWSAETRANSGLLGLAGLLPIAAIF